MRRSEGARTLGRPCRRRARTVSAYPSPHTTRAWPSACEKVQRSTPSLSAPAQRHTPYARPPPTAPAPAISCKDRARAEGLAGGGQPGEWAARGHSEAVIRRRSQACLATDTPAAQRPIKQIRMGGPKDFTLPPNCIGTRWRTCCPE
jgi:hypothetical protein